MNPQDAEVPSTPDTPNLTEPAYADPLNLLLAEVRACAAHPRAVILAAHGIVELLVNTLVDLRCVNAKSIANDNRSYSHGVKLLILNEKGVLNADRFEILNRFRKLRNDVVHNFDSSVSNDRLIGLLGHNQYQLRHKPPVNDEELRQNVVVACLLVVGFAWVDPEALSQVFKNPCRTNQK